MSELSKELEREADPSPAAPPQPPLLDLLLGGRGEAQAEEGCAVLRAGQPGPAQV